jgi:hypothetical protein
LLSSIVLTVRSVALHVVMYAKETERVNCSAVNAAGTPQMRITTPVVIMSRTFPPQDFFCIV